MKKYAFLLIFTLFGAYGAFAQIFNPVSWTYTAKKINPTTYEVHITGTIQPGWHVYTIDHKADIGVATAVNLKKNPLATPSGNLKAVGKSVSAKDPSTGEMVKFYENKIDLVQVVKLKAPVKTSITGTVEFMACDDKQCLPPTEREFTVALN